MAVVVVSGVAVVVVLGLAVVVVVAIAVGVQSSELESSEKLNTLPSSSIVPLAVCTSPLKSTVPLIVTPPPVAVKESPDSEPCRVIVGSETNEISALNALPSIVINRQAPPSWGADC